MIGFFKADGSNNKGRRRKRAQPLWRRTGFRSGVVVAMISAMGAGGWFAWSNGAVGHYARLVAVAAVELSSSVGFRVHEVLVVGRNETGRAALLDALGVDHGSAMFDFDVDLARERIEALPWVRRATVKRLLPATILIGIEERQPLALWQNKGAFGLIDDEGIVITRKNLGRFGHLLTVVGEDAPLHVAVLLEMLGTQPELMKHVSAAVRVGTRRWNIRMKDDMDVRLPEQGAATAWSRFAEYERLHGLLERDLEIVDLRVPDRLIVRKRGDENRKTIPTPGQET